MNIRKPNDTFAERWCEDCFIVDPRRATHVIDLRGNTINLCDDHFTELAIALSLAVTEEHPSA